VTEQPSVRRTRTREYWRRSERSVDDRHPKLPAERTRRFRFEPVDDAVDGTRFTIEIGLRQRDELRVGSSTDDVKTTLHRRSSA